MSKMLFIFFYAFKILASTNLGTISSIRESSLLSTVEDCQFDPNRDCPRLEFAELENILNFSSDNICIANPTNSDDFPLCPDEGTNITGLDNTYPTGGIFALFTGDNASFVFDLAGNYLEQNEMGIFNLILPRSNVSKLIGNDNLTTLLNNPRVNIIEVETMPWTGRWMQDSFQFVSLEGKPALYQLDHFSETGRTLEQRIACEVAKQCNIPYYIPSEFIHPESYNDDTLNSGGNLEVMPGGTFLMGTGQSQGDLIIHSGTQSEPVITEHQLTVRQSLIREGNNILEIDISFLRVGHVDEIVNFVRTNKPAPCDYAVLMASPEKAFELLETSASDERLNLLSTNRDNERVNDLPENFETQTANDSRSCFTYDQIKNFGMEEIITHGQVEHIYSRNCIDDRNVSDFVGSDLYQNLRTENIGPLDNITISQIMSNNRATLKRELKRTTGCEEPIFVDVPVFFRDGLSYTPDLVNGVVQTNPGSPSSVILPRTYFRPFDEYIKEELLRLGVRTQFAHDMGYHLLGGEVHCGTNSAQICRTR